MFPCELNLTAFRSVSECLHRKKFTYSRNLEGLRRTEESNVIYFRPVYLSPVTPGPGDGMAGQTAFISFDLNALTGRQ